MRFDSLSMYSDGQTLSNSSVDSTNTLETGKGIGATGSVIVVRFDSDAHGCTSVELHCDPAGGSAFKVYGTHAVMDTTAGTGVTIPLPDDLKGKTKLVYKGASMKGKVTAGIVLRAPSARGSRIGDYAANV